MATIKQAENKIKNDVKTLYERYPKRFKLNFLVSKIEDNQFKYLTESTITFNDSLYLHPKYVKKTLDSLILVYK